jgi:hypothetical protein
VAGRGPERSFRVAHFIEVLDNHRIDARRLSPCAVATEFEQESTAPKSDSTALIRPRKSPPCVRPFTDIWRALGLTKISCLV